MNSAPHQRVDRVPLGIMYMLGATFVFAISTAMSKWQVDTYSFAEVLCFRSLGSLAICSLLILPRKGLSVFRTQHLGQHLGRSTTQATAQSCIIIALSFMPLAGVVAINFSSPLFATLAAVLWLKEKVGKERLAALLVGFCGVLLVAGPGADSFRIGALFALCNAVLLGSVTAAVRGMSKTESAETLTMFQMVILTVFFTIAMALFGFVTPTWQDVGLMLVNGIFNGLGQYWWTRSLSLAPASAVGPFYYFSIVFALVIGFMVWGDIPTLALLAGAAIVVASGLYLLWHESKKRAPMTAEEPLD
jgi:drug/metabolite transporter (DMT)-like permease